MRKLALLLITLTFVLSGRTAEADEPGAPGWSTPYNTLSDEAHPVGMLEGDAADTIWSQDRVDALVDRICQETDREADEIRRVAEERLAEIWRRYERVVEFIELEKNSLTNAEKRERYSQAYKERDSAINRVYAEKDAELNKLTERSDRQKNEIYKRRQAALDKKQRQEKTRVYEAQRPSSGGAQSIANSAVTLESNTSRQSALRIAGIKTVYQTTEVPFQPTIRISGTGLKTISRIRWFWRKAGGAPFFSEWHSSNDFDGKFIVENDAQGLARPVLLVPRDTLGTYFWRVEFSAGSQHVDSSFKVIYAASVQKRPSEISLPATRAIVTPVYDQLASGNRLLYVSKEWAEALDKYAKQPRKKLTCLSVVYAMIQHARGNASYRVGPSTYTDTAGALRIRGVAGRADEEKPDVEEIRREITLGNPVILRGWSDAVGENHFVLATSIDAYGRIVANDPFGGQQIRIDPGDWRTSNSSAGTFKVVGMRLVDF